MTMKLDDTISVDNMKVAVVGLGVEGINAVKSLLDQGYEVYASDIEKNIEIEHQNNLEIDLGYHDIDKIDSADATVLSPSLWNSKIAQRVRENKKCLSDVIEDHKAIFTIGVTGTNGKTTTCLMIKNILEKTGFKVLVGGNAGGGFEGYTEIILEASNHEYDFLVVEVCDMTLEFCTYSFDLDLVVVTNIGQDHLDVHNSLENYRRSLSKFLEGKIAILNENDELIEQAANDADKVYFFRETNKRLNIFGKFNLENAAAAEETAKYLNIPDTYIKEALENFRGVDGRITKINFPESNIIIGKTDNVDAAAAVFNEQKFEVAIIGTPRENETWRYDIFKEVSRADPDVVALFPGLDDTRKQASEILRRENYKGDIKFLEDLDDVLDFTLQCTQQYENIFIGGNGQDKIIKIHNKLQRYAKG